MNRDTMMARWYRRIDPDCFTAPRLIGDVDGIPAMENSPGAVPEPEATVYATAVSDHWPSVAGNRRGWAVEAVADCL